MDVSMDGLVHPVREIDVRKYVLVYSSRVLSSVAQRVSSLYAHACCTLSVPGALHEVQISCMWEARHFVMLCDGQSSPKTRRSERQKLSKASVLARIRRGSGSARGLAMDETKKGDIIEAFGIHGNNAPTVDKHIFGIVLRSVGMNPTNDEIADMFQKGSKGGMIDATTCVAMAIGFLAKSKDNDKEYVCRVCASSSCSASAAALYPDALRPAAQIAGSLRRLRQGERGQDLGGGVAAGDFQFGREGGRGRD